MNPITGRPATPTPTAGPFIDARDGTRLFHLDWGAGKPVVFSHAWGLSADLWEYQMTELAERGLRCIAYDRRGHGRSADPGHGYDFDTLADDLATLLEALDLSGVTLVGHSMGGGEVARYLSRHGAARIARTVLVSAVTPIVGWRPDHPTGTDPQAVAAFIAALKQDRPATITAGGQFALRGRQVGRERHLDRAASRQRRDRPHDVPERVEPRGPGEAEVERRHAVHAVEPERAQIAPQVAHPDDVPAAASTRDAVGIEVALGVLEPGGAVEQPNAPLIVRRGAQRDQRGVVARRGRRRELERHGLADRTDAATQLGRHHALELGCALATAAAGSAIPSSRTASSPTESARASSLLNIIGGSRKPATSA